MVVMICMEKISILRNGIFVELYEYVEDFYLISKTEVNCLLRVMGENTLQIYVIHCFVTAGLRLVFKVAGIKNLFLYMIVGTILGVLIPVVIAKICTRIYCLNFVFQPTKTIQRLRSC